MPAPLVAAAEKAGLPLLEVPERTPFIAVTKAVSRLLAAEEYDEAARGFAAQRELIRAALTADDGGAAAVVARLAKHVGGFALVLDPAGGVVHASPASAAARAADLAGEIARLRPKGLLASAVVSGADEYVVIQPLGVRGRARGFLAVGAPRAAAANDQAVVNLAVSLLSLSLARSEGRTRGRARRACRCACGSCSTARAVGCRSTSSAGRRCARDRCACVVARPAARTRPAVAAAEDRLAEALPGAPSRRVLVPTTRAGRCSRSRCRVARRGRAASRRPTTTCVGAAGVGDGAESTTRRASALARPGPAGAGRAVRRACAATTTSAAASRRCSTPRPPTPGPPRCSRRSTSRGSGPTSRRRCSPGCAATARSTPRPPTSACTGTPSGTGCAAPRPCSAARSTTPASAPSSTSPSPAPRLTRRRFRMKVPQAA